jgi:hypothetical protein
MDAPRSPLLPAIAGLLLLLLYGAVTWVNGFFILTDFDYLRDKAVILFSFRQPHLASMLWKIVLVLPASVLLAIALVRAGIRLRMPSPMHDRSVLLPVMLAALTVIVLCITIVFHGTELTDDENVYLFQARTLLLARTTNPPPPVQASFDDVFLINDGRQWSGKYNLGHPAVIALGLLAGSRYAATVVLSILTIPLVYVIARKLEWKRRTALLAAGLLAISPFFYLVSSSLLSHTTAGFALALFFATLLSARNRAGRLTGIWTGLAAGVALGVAFNVRPLTAVGYALPFGVWLGGDLLSRKSGTLALVGSVAAGFAAVVAATMAHNLAVTGNALVFPFSYYNAEERLGFGVYGHTPVMALNNLAVSFVRLNSFLLGFPLSLAFAAVPIACRMNLGEKLASGVVGSLSVVYLFYWAPGVSDLGPVYYYEMLVPLVLLSASGAFRLHGWVASRFPSHEGFVPVFLATSLALALFTFVPERLTHVKRLADQVREPYETLEAAGPSNALVLVQSVPHKGWVFGYRHPDPSLREDILLCAYADRTSNMAVLDAFPDREAYVMWYDPQWQRTNVKRVTRAELMSMPAQPAR